MLYLFICFALSLVYATFRCFSAYFIDVVLLVVYYDLVVLLPMKAFCIVVLFSFHMMYEVFKHFFSCHLMFMLMVAVTVMKSKFLCMPFKYTYLCIFLLHDVCFRVNSLTHDVEAIKDGDISESDFQSDVS